MISLEELDGSTDSEGSLDLGITYGIAPLKTWKVFSYVMALRQQKLSDELLPLFDFSNKRIPYPGSEFFAQPAPQFFESVCSGLQIPYMSICDPSAVCAPWVQISVNPLRSMRLMPLKIQYYRSQSGPCGFSQLRTVVPIDYVEQTEGHVFLVQNALARLVPVDFNEVKARCTARGQTVVFTETGHPVGLRCPICEFTFYEVYYASAADQRKAFLHHLALERMRIHGALSQQEDFEARWRLLLNEGITRVLMTLQQFRRQQVRQKPSSKMRSLINTSKYDDQ